MSQSSSMSSVWETLNKMKQRQKAAEQATARHKRNDSSRKDSLHIFESAVAKAAQKNTLDGGVLLSQLFDENQAPNSPLRVVVQSHKQRLTKSTAVTVELTAIRTALQDVSKQLAVVGMNLDNAEQSMSRMQ